MTYFHHIDPLEQRALAMPRMRAMLEGLSAKHAKLHPSVTQETLWKPAGGRHDNEGRVAHIDAAREAGFITEDFFGGSIRTRYALTDKGYQAINQQRPFWEGAA